MPNTAFEAFPWMIPAEAPQPRRPPEELAADQLVVEMRARFRAEAEAQEKARREAEHAARLNPPAAATPVLPGKSVADLVEGRAEVRDPKPGVWLGGAAPGIRHVTLNAKQK